MSCPHYYFKSNDYYCLKREEYVSSDTYYKYCRNYDYDDCPVYKGESSSGGCYITSACVYALGCSDDSEELNALRIFRDTYVKIQPQGMEDITEYYKYAPRVVDKINEQNDRDIIFQNIFYGYIKPCLDLIADELYYEAYRLYKEMFISLKKKYIMEEY